MEVEQWKMVVVAGGLLVGMLSGGVLEVRDSLDSISILEELCCIGQAFFQKTIYVAFFQGFRVLV